MKGSEKLIETLIEHGNDTSFGIIGGVIIPLFDAMLQYEGKFKNIISRHEQGAAHAAEGYARASGKTGVCIGTSGPGATNLVTGIADAYMDSTPIIAIGGQVALPLIGNDAFQETDMLGVTLPITKHNMRINHADEIPGKFDVAYKLANEGRPGPVFIELPKDPQVQDFNPDKAVKIELPGFKVPGPGNPTQIKKAAKAILDAEKPLFLIGGGVILGNATKEALNLIDTVKAPFTYTLMGKGAIPDNHPWCTGMLGMHGKKAANYAAIKCDLLIAIGCRFSDRITGNTETFAPNAKVIHIDIDPAEIDKNIKTEIPIVGDAKSVMKDLAAEVLKQGAKDHDTAWRSRMKQMIEICECSLDEQKSTISPNKLLFELRRAIGEDDIITTGVGQHQMFAAHFLKTYKPRNFISSGGLGTMGFGFPASIGAKVARPEAEVFNMDGDGSFGMVIQELATCKDYDIKTIQVIFNNSFLGMVRQWQEIFFDKRYSGVKLGYHSDFPKIAEGYGLSGIDVRSPSDIAPALEQAKKNDETTVINVTIDEESNILPMLPPGGNLDEFFGGKCMKNWKEMLKE